MSGEYVRAWKYPGGNVDNFVHAGKLMFDIRCLYRTATVSYDTRLHTIDCYFLSVAW